MPNTLSGERTSDRSTYRNLAAGTVLLSADDGVLKSGSCLLYSPVFVVSVGAHAANDPPLFRPDTSIYVFPPLFSSRPPYLL